MLSLWREDNNPIIAEYPVLCETPKNLLGLPTNTRIAITSVYNAPDGLVEISLEAEKLALFVTLTSSLEGNFDENVFVLSPRSKKVR